MKIKIGIIGGVGPQATSYLYNQVIDIAHHKYKATLNSDFPELLIYSIPVPDFISDKQHLDLAQKMFARVLSDFEKVNVSHIAIASNTVHLLLDQFKQMTSASFLSMIDAVVEEVVASSYQTVGLLASSTTVKKKLYELPLTEQDVSLIVPSQPDQGFIDLVIKATIAGDDVTIYGDRLNQIVDNLPSQKIILGCTELPLVFRNLGFNLDRFIISTDILAKKITKVYYNAKK